MSKIRFFYVGTFIFFFFTFFLIAPIIYSAQVTITWDANTEPDLAGYNIYYGTASRTYQTNVDVGNNTTVTIPNLQDDVIYYFAVTAYNRSGEESEYSNEATYIPNFLPDVCGYSINPTVLSFSSLGGVGSVQINTPTGCFWTATSNAGWVLISSNAKDSGNGIVHFSVAPNESRFTRTGILTIAEQSLKITQTGKRWR